MMMWVENKDITTPASTTQLREMATQQTTRPQQWWADDGAIIRWYLGLLPLHEAKTTLVGIVLKGYFCQWGKYIVDTCCWQMAAMNQKLVSDIAVCWWWQLYHLPFVDKASQPTMNASGGQSLLVGGMAVNKVASGCADSCVYASIGVGFGEEVTLLPCWFCRLLLPIAAAAKQKQPQG